MVKRKKKKPKSEWWWDYRSRNDRLKTLGYETYGDYLKSPLWRSIRRTQFTKSPICEMCHSKAEVVHHKTYAVDVLRGKTLVGLASLCNACHERIEWDGDIKRSLTATNTLLKQGTPKAQNGQSKQRRATKLQWPPSQQKEGLVKVDPNVFERCSGCKILMKPERLLGGVCGTCRKRNKSKKKKSPQKTLIRCARCNKVRNKSKLDSFGICTICRRREHNRKPTRERGAVRGRRFLI